MPSPLKKPGHSARTLISAEAVLQGRVRGPRAMLPFIGPAVIASVAYVDPGNFATNIAAGSTYGYRLLWVVLLANVTAMLFQALSARLGIATGKNIAELCRDSLPFRAVITLWLINELGAMATDLAEFLGGAIGLSLLFGLPLLAGMVVVGIITLAILLLERGGFRPLELAIGAIVGLIGLCYVVELALVPPDWLAAARGAVLPVLPDHDALLLAVGIVGATVMPHAIFLHSGLTQMRVLPATDAERHRLTRLSDIEVIGALTFAGLVNGAMLMMAAAAFGGGKTPVTTIDMAYRTLIPLFGGAAAAVFLVSLMASGISSSVVGTMAGQLIMQGFLRRQIPVWVRRLLTMLPGFAVVAIGVNPTRALILSQVVLSFVVPVPMVALILFSRQKALMGELALTRSWFYAAALLTALTIALNLVLLWQSLVP
jgi:manganese transport protein